MGGLAQPPMLGADLKKSEKQPGALPTDTRLYCSPLVLLLAAISFRFARTTLVYESSPLTFPPTVRT
jgi:hypothetical protein